MDDADHGMEASAATIRDRVRRQNAVTLNHQQAIYTENLRPSENPIRLLDACTYKITPLILLTHF